MEGKQKFKITIMADLVFYLSDKVLWAAQHTERESDAISSRSVEYPGLIHLRLALAIHTDLL